MSGAAPAPLWTAASVAAATGGLAAGEFAADGVVLDSREAKAGDLFVALAGASADGHDFVEDARARGAAGALVSRPVLAPHVRVADTQAGLEALGAAARARAAEATVIGVTGSVGKTGCKEALRLAFCRTHPDRTHWSEKSYNNHTGVPLSLARMPPDARWAVFEMGMNHAGEIARLTRQVRPHVALVTWVASAHIENFPDGEPGIARAKAEIFEGVEPGGIAVIPADNRHAPILAARARALGLEILAFGRSPEARVRLVSAEERPEGTEVVADVAGERLAFRLGLPGAHWVSNALAVLAAVHAVGGDLAEAGLALAEMAPLPGRGARVEVPLAGGAAILLDESYNANPASMEAALAVLARAPGRRLAVLGAMKELGAASDALHAALAGAIARAGLAELALVGPEMEALRLPGAAHLPDAEAALAWVRARLRPGDTLLVKGSNAVGLSRIVEALGRTAEAAQ